MSEFENGAVINVEMTPKDNINVVIGEAAKIDAQEAITYIKSGKAEIEKAVDDGINAFDTNATNKTSGFNTNATNKTNDFNDNAAEKQAAVDASAAEAKQWAIGDPTEPTGNSAKYWANQAHDELSSIEALIPSQASPTNQLADKNFVNSSISTNTANFIGTFNSVAELEAYSGTLTNNDYAFVVGTDSAGNTVYNRYKYTDATTPPSWVFEYALNNSSFTASQWAAINSGATTANISSIASKANDNAVVHLAGSETISGAKTFTNQITLFSSDAERYIVLKNTSADALTTPSSTLYTGTISTRDKNDKQITNIRSALLTNGSQLSYNIRNYSEGNKHIQALFRATAYSDGGADATFYVSNNGSGDTRTVTNRCLSSSTSSTTETRLACQGWVNNPSASTNVVHRSGAETITGNKTFSGTVAFTGTVTGVTATLPTGMIMAFAGSTAPTGFLLCDGSAVSRTTYADLYAVIGDTYGAGDGSTTFNVPNLQDKFLQGAGTNSLGTTMSAGLPNITSGSWYGVLANYDSTEVTGSAVRRGSDYVSNGKTSSGDMRSDYNFDASRSSSIYGNSTTVQPPAVCVNFIIRI